METNNVQFPPVEDPEIKFKLHDKIIRQIINADINEPLVEISGYDLQINFNMKYLKSVEDVEAACDGIATLFRETIMDKLLEAKKQNE